MFSVTTLIKPRRRITDPGPNAPEGATITILPFEFGAKSHIRLIVTFDLLRFYRTFGRSL